MKNYWYIPVSYLIFGLAWIFLSDLLVARMAGEMDEITQAQILKGSLFVVSSALLVFVLLYRATRRLEELERVRQAERLALLRQVHHILLNYLNQMQLVTMEADQCEGFSKEMVALARRLSDEAAVELRKLSALSGGDENGCPGAGFGQ